MMDVTVCVGESNLASLRDTCEVWSVHSPAVLQTGLHLPLTDVSVASNNDDFLGHGLCIKSSEMAGNTWEAAVG